MKGSLNINSILERNFPTFQPDALVLFGAKVKLARAANLARVDPIPPVAFTDEHCNMTHHDAYTCIGRCLHTHFTFALKKTKACRRNVGKVSSRNKVGKFREPIIGFSLPSLLSALSCRLRPSTALGPPSRPVHQHRLQLYCHLLLRAMLSPDQHRV